MSDEPKHAVPIQSPPFRRLRTYAFDPSLGLQPDTLGLNETILRVPWEAGPGPAHRNGREPAHRNGREPAHRNGREPAHRNGSGPAGKNRPGTDDEAFVGPVGEYLEVVDYDPANRCFYAPVDLNHPLLLAQDGLAPSEGNPQFHQQMVYAVAMTTIHHFERALGRLALWAPRCLPGDSERVIKAEYVRRLRIYPHALREANAYYSPEKKALLFGYFPASCSAAGRNLPGGMVFTCLSHDVVAHETTHALLDGMQHHFVEPSNPDVLAFHEAFADLVALFQHFTQPEALRHTIARTRGDLAQQNLLGDLARQFGQAIGNRGALRSAINEKEVDPADYANRMEPHARGAILVAAVFEAFLTVYKARIADLLRIASGGTGRLPEGEIHPDLVNRLADEAARTADRFLQNGIRALDYCPPVDITFGDYLRAMVTADRDFGSDESMFHSVALVEAFRRRGIYPREVRTLSVDALLWPVPEGMNAFDVPDFIQAIYMGRVDEEADDHGPGPAYNVKRLNDEFMTWAIMSDRKKAYARMHADAQLVRRWLAENAEKLGNGQVLGLALGDHQGYRTISNRKGKPSFEVHSVRPARRQGDDGRPATDLVVQITQERAGYLDPDVQREADEGKAVARRRDFTFRGGCTLVIDLPNAEVRRCVVKDIRSEARLEYQRRYRSDTPDRSLWATYFGGADAHDGPAEPFAMLHRNPEGGQP